MTDNIMKLKFELNKIAKEKGVPAPVITQNYMLERFLVRLSNSRYAENIILKGGLLIAQLVDISNRNTKDMDALISATDFNEESITVIFNEVAGIDIGDGVKFEVVSISPIREDNGYAGYRIKAKAIRETLIENLQFDFSSGDPVVPHPIIREYKSLISDDKIEVNTYSIETILAEKLQTIFSHGVGATRMRDYYDVFLLEKIYANNINANELLEALEKTINYRNTISVFENWSEQLDRFNDNETLLDNWGRFIKKSSYVNDVGFKDVIGSIRNIQMIAPITCLQAP